jgi:hypothetical protein
MNRILLLLLAIVLLAGGAFAGMTAGSECITVTTPLSVPISHFKSAYVSNDVGSSIALWLGKNDIEKVYSRQAADLEVKCESERGWAPPQLGRHFDVIAEGYTKISIKFVDIASNAVIGEVQYKRPKVKVDIHNLWDQMLDKLTGQQYGLTDFSKWEKRTFPKSRLMMDVPAGFRNIGEKSHPGNLLTFYMHPMGPADTRLFIEVTIFDSVKAEEEKRSILNGPNARNDPEYRRYFEWQLSYQPEFTNMPEFKVNGPRMNYLRDLKTKTGEIIRARASLNTQLRPEGYAVDETAIKRILESLETY